MRTNCNEPLLLSSIAHIQVREREKSLFWGTLSSSEIAALNVLRKIIAYLKYLGGYPQCQIINAQFFYVQTLLGVNMHNNIHGTVKERK